MSMKIKLEFQYFKGCPHQDPLRKNLLQAIRGIEDRVEMAEILVEDEESAVNVKFRGSPTLLINGEDLLGMPPPDKPSLSCRLYQKGVPSAALIRRKIEEAYS